MDLFAKPGEPAAEAPKETETAAPSPNPEPAPPQPAPVTVTEIAPPAAPVSAPVEPPPLEHRVARLFDLFDFSKGPAASTPREGKEPISLPLPDHLPPHPDALVEPAALARTDAPVSATPAVLEQARPRTSTPLAVGIRHRLGKEPDGDGSCFERVAEGPRFCIEFVRWPGEIEPFFAASSQLYKGTKAVVRYVGGRADSIFGLFPTENFERIAAHFARVLGGPDRRHSLPMAVIGDPGARNQVVMWREKTDGGVTIFEIRRADDLRGMMPDTDFGVFRLYRESAVPIFQTVDMSDFVVHSIRATSVATGKTR